MRCLSIGTLLVSLVLCGVSRADSGLVTDKLAKKLDTLTFTGLDGKDVAVTSIKDKKAIVIVFLSFECPVSNDYSTTLTAMAKAYADKGIAFVAVTPTEDDPVVVKKNATDYKLPFPVYIDPQANTIDALKATTTPEAFVLDANYVLRYRGRIDNAYSARLKKNAHTTEFDLKNALEDLLAGRDVKTPATPTIGCPLVTKGSISKPVTTKVTYYKDVLPILQNHCQECHRPNQVGPFSLMTYKQAVNWAADIKYYTQTRQMPPWKPTDGPHFTNERKLNDAELKVLADWADGGTPEGDVKDAPKPREFVDGWRLGKPDLILTVEEDFILGPSGRDTFRCFVLPTKLEEDKYIIGFEVKPGNNRVVHHTLNFWDLTGTGRKLAEEAKKNAKPEDQDRGPGYSAAMGVGFIGTPGKFGGFGGWAPGQVPTFLPEDTGYFLPKGADVIIQTHYHRDGKEEKDRLQIGLYFAKKPVKHRYQTLVVNGLSPFSMIPAGKANYVSKGSAIVNEDCTIYSVMPHMHLLGKSVKVTMTTPEGSTRTLVDIANWDYNWQETYWFKEPIQVRQGTRLDIEAVFDNSDKNPNNPNSPPKLVMVGEQTTNEMLFGFLGATASDPTKRLRAVATRTPQKDEKK